MGNPSSWCCNLALDGLRRVQAKERDPKAAEKATNTNMPPPPKPAGKTAGGEAPASFGPCGLHHSRVTELQNLVPLKLQTQPATQAVTGIPATAWQNACWFASPGLVLHATRSSLRPRDPKEAINLAVCRWAAVFPMSIVMNGRLCSWARERLLNDRSSKPMSSL